MNEIASIDAAAFDSRAVSDEVREFNAALVGGMEQLGWTFPPESLERLRGVMTAAGEPYRSPRARALVAPSPGGGIPLRVIDSPEPTGVYVHCHAGGWTIGASDMQDERLERIVEATGMTAVSIEYRRAPEHPYPAPLDDCARAARWISDHASEQFGAERLVIGGESAGANLALCALLRLKRDGAHAAFAAANLLYGNYDLTMTPSQRHGERGVLITRRSLDWFYDRYVPDAAVRGTPDVSPLYADLTGLPPVLLSVGTADSLVDDTVFLACRLLASEVPCELLLVPGAEHGFDSAPVPAAQAAVAHIDEYLAAAVRP
ncbi:alpha/beta hydrolase [Conexibacter sp. CPCC 206217]|uniref:alpha/beta hydrolase n=1 Tax=Conexibacter sp. CPCC 206217 TaxID=3064574 RepID=UPI0027252022|nr:alpha/beta hydrolase [Conexibacter sp. CPCC 206217]MDO8212002.1 alpha/beta hydrolase [Conexibacter sp. CPCC 206217]